MVLKAICELSRHVNDMVHLMYGPESASQLQQLENLHTSLRSWYGSLPEDLRRGRTFLPGALFVQYVSLVFWIRASLT